MSRLEQKLGEFLDILFTRNVLIELSGIALCLLAAWFAGRAVHRWYESRGRHPPPAMNSAYLSRRIGQVTAPYLIALALLLLLRLAVSALHLDDALVEIAVRLVSAYVFVRICVLVFEATLGEKSWLQSWESRAALFIWLVVAAEMLDWLDPIVATLDQVGITAGRNRITLWSILKLLFTLTIFMVVATWIGRWIERRLMKLHSVALSTRIGISKFLSAVLIGLSILLGLNAAGVDLTALTVLTGAIGLGLGFGLQSIAANFVSGFVLLMDRSIKPGDVISFTGQTGTSTEGFGWVQELRGRYVVVRDRDGVEMLVPNQHLISNPVINWSYTDPRVRLKLPVRISYHDDPELAMQLLLQACDGQRRVLHDPLPVSRLMHFGENGIDLELRFWISDPQEGVNNVRSEVNRTIWRLFKEQGITIPVAQREIYMRAARDPD
ncbi:MAG: mechanosensitive ion channel [Steroidobacteraceae bacterium]